MVNVPNKEACQQLQSHNHKKNKVLTRIPSDQTIRTSGRVTKESLTP